MTPEIIDAAKWLGGIAVALIAWLARKSIERVEADLSSKADKDQMRREIERLNMEIKESRDARDRDIERLERANAEKFSEFSASMRDRLSTFERNVEGKLEMILSIVTDLRKEK